ncbi:3-keto-disaccharide hydrolase [Thalassoroseus pseudoceratinae]|uniref:3-keto-disaccharide hydrolase n=1 Tax=Thalassoroseus pseudoceratinae TaxID=2713176 RepID=UPI00141E2E7A|nr:DUF1080 domain-containing protein [Thalassoroseus pseudoceratinae]
MTSWKIWMLTGVVWMTSVAGANAADPLNELTKEERQAGWELLFNGEDYTGWMCNNGKEIASPIEDHAMVPYKSGGYLIIHKEPVSDFILKCDVKMPEQCNSGIFFRVADPKDPVQTGFEMQVMSGKGTGYHDFGAVYDLAKPALNAASPTGEWTAIKLICKGPHVQVIVNGKVTTETDLSKFTEVGKRPDGSKHKFTKHGKPVSEWPHKGYVGFQDHGHPVWYRNVKLLDLTEHPAPNAGK